MKKQSLFVPLTLVAISGCSSDAEPTSDGGADDVVCRMPTLPAGGPPFSLTAAGAPVALFGQPSTPTFESGFRALLDIGFTRFFPFFGLREIVDRPEGDTTSSLSSASST